MHIGEGNHISCCLAVESLSQGPAIICSRKLGCVYPRYGLGCGCVFIGVKNSDRLASEIIFGTHDLGAPRADVVGSNILSLLPGSGRSAASENFHETIDFALYCGARGVSFHVLEGPHQRLSQVLRGLACMELRTRKTLQKDVSCGVRI